MGGFDVGDRLLAHDLYRLCLFMCGWSLELANFAALVVEGNSVQKSDN